MHNADRRSTRKSASFFRSHRLLRKLVSLEMPAFTAAEIAWHMRCHASDLRHQWITPNALLYAWESDLLTVTPEGYVCEIEIKCSRSDLNNDLKKPKHSQGMLMNGSFFEKRSGAGLTLNEQREQDRRLNGAKTCRRPNYFCFAMPCSVYRSGTPPRIPSYAGVYTVDRQGRVFEERRPIQLHGERISTEDLLDLARRMHHRYWDVIRRARHAPGTVAAEDDLLELERPQLLVDSDRSVDLADASMERS